MNEGVRGGKSKEGREGVMKRGSLGGR